MFNKKKLNKLILTDRYKSSNYKIQKLNNAYALLNTKTKKYVDLNSQNYEWNNKSRFFKDCLGCRINVINTFNYRCPIIVKLKIEKTY